VNRIPRRLIDRIFSLAYPVHRYRCRSCLCTWEGNLPYDALDPDAWDPMAPRSPRQAPASSIAPETGLGQTTNNDGNAIH
jgi:hypothetical protein